MRIGICKTCGHTPVAKNALVCPSCGRLSPNPGFFSKWISRLVTLVFIAIAIAIVITVVSSNG